MTRIRLRRAAPMAALGLLAAAAPAVGDITGTVTTPGGVPVPNASVTALEPDGSTAGIDFTEPDGTYRITTASLASDTPPFTIRARKFDACRTSDQQRQVDATPAANDNEVRDITLDVLGFCATPFVSSTLPPPTGGVDTERGVIFGAPGALVYIDVLAPTGATGFSVALADGTVIATNDDDDGIPVRAPAGGYQGPLTVSYTVNGVVMTRGLATADFRKTTRAVLPPGPVDIVNIVDESGSMSVNDRGFQRKRAVEAVLDLASRGDGVAAVGFDHEPRRIFDYTTISGSSVRNRLKRVARRRIGNGGGTDYNDAFDAAYAALTGPKVDPARPKAAIFLTDGANGSVYRNGHLRFAFNPTGRTWPVCAVQLGRGFQAKDVALLKRIARETGGVYFRRPNNAELTNVYFECVSRTAGATRLLNKRTVLVRRGQTKQVRRRIPRGLKEATFFVGWNTGVKDVRLRDPRGRIYTARLRRGAIYGAGQTYRFFTVKKPRPGVWTVRIRVVRQTGRDFARTNIFVAKR